MGLPSPSHIRKGSTCLQINMVGSSTQDIYLSVPDASLSASTITFSANGKQFLLPYQGDPIVWGHKRFLHSDITSQGELLQQATRVENGGGGRNTAVHMVQLAHSSDIVMKVLLIDTTTGCTSLTDECRALAIDYVPLGLEREPRNLILTDVCADRIVLKSPVSTAGMTSAQEAHVRELCRGPLDAILINSPKSAKLVEVVIHASQTAGIPVYAVLTPSLPMVHRLTLLQMGQGLMSNLAEFALICEALGIDCPRDEANAPLESVASAMIRAAHRHHMRGCLVITLGTRGCLVHTPGPAVVWQISLKPVFQEQVQATLCQMPGHKNGVGDRFFGSFVLAHVLGGPMASAGQAALQASVDTVRTLAPELSLDATWFDRRRFSQVRRSIRIRGPQPHHMGTTAEV